MDKHELATLIDKGIYPAPDLSKQALDRVLGFMTMVETIKKGNLKWTLYEIVNEWHMTSFNEEIEDEPEFFNHTITKIMAHLIMRGYKNFKVVTPRAFIKLYKLVMSDDWWNLKPRKIRKITYQITELFPITPYHFTLN